MLKVGLTGGIGSGKSQAVKFFRQLEAAVIDADEIVRHLSQPETAEFDCIRQEFGDRILNHKGRLNRAKIREIIFHNTALKRKLEAIIHPSVRRRLREYVQAIDAPYCILTIPLLVEARMLDLVDLVVVVDCCEDKQIQRVMSRDNCDRKHALMIVRSQMTRCQRLAIADIVIDNNGTLGQLQKAVECTHKKFKNYS